MSSPTASLVVATPHGPFTALADADGAVLASGWTDDVDDLLALVHPALRPDATAAASAGGDLGVIVRAVTAYHDGDPAPVAAVPVRQRGGAFTEHVWDRMREIGAGEPVTYGELAARAGRPTAVRAVGVACARNAATLFVPCHRVLGSGGRVTGFRWGTALATTLLEDEAATRSARSARSARSDEDCRSPEASCAP